jgi:putative serine protease PepD
MATTGSPAATAGLTAGDLITSLDGRAASSASYSRLLLTAKVGDQVPVVYLRGGQTHQASITLTEQPTN